MIQLLAIVLFILLVLIGGERGVITFLSLCWNIAILLIAITLMSWGWNPLVITFLSCVLISNITLFYQNGKNAKTIASFLSVLIVILLLFFITYKMGYATKIGGIDEILQHDSEVFGLSVDIGINMPTIAISMIIIGLIGAAMDTSIAVASAVYEVYKNNRYLSRTELFQSGIGIGRDILGTTVNTLYFAYVGESMMLFILFKNFNYSLLEIINSKAFFQEFEFIMFSGISCVLIIPITAFIVSHLLTNSEKYKKFLDEDELFKEQALQ